MKQMPLIKCECEECNCDNATAADFGVCYECSSGLHATSKWKDGVKVRKQEKQLDEGK